MAYTGRFAPSPTGWLHFGSLLAAAASYLQVRCQQGRWLLRIEDLDKPREQAGASQHIIQTLAAYGFCWDAPLIFQSQRLEAYSAALHHLRADTYPCTCSRKQLAESAIQGTYGPVYPGTCRQQTATQLRHALRVRTPEHSVCFQDKVQGLFCQNLAKDCGDFVIRRADQLFAYQLAVVVDDAWQGVTEVVRGSDLLDNTPRQLYLQKLLGLPHPSYAHIPVIVNAQGQKLSKQTRAPALSTDTASILHNLCAALAFLGQNPPAAADFSSVQACWDWAIGHWEIRNIPRVMACTGQAAGQRAG